MFSKIIFLFSLSGKNSTRFKFQKLHQIIKSVKVCHSKRQVKSVDFCISQNHGLISAKNIDNCLIFDRTILSNKFCMFITAQYLKTLEIKDSVCKF